VDQMRLTMSKAAVRAEAKDQDGRGGEGGLGGIDRVRRFKSQTPLLLVREAAEELLSQSLRFPHCLISCFFRAANRMAEMGLSEAGLGVSG